MKQCSTIKFGKGENVNETQKKKKKYTKEQTQRGPPMAL